MTTGAVHQPVDKPKLELPLSLGNTVQTSDRSYKDFYTLGQSFIGLAPVQTDPY